jgi:hypothetical protein
MASGGNLPYQLRPNKAVERLLFVDLLSIFDHELHIGRDYGYFGFGGPQMEDFRLLHERFAQMQMISIEKEEAVIKRQRFNEPHTNVKCQRKNSGEFIRSFRPKTPVIVWLDYTEPAPRPQQIAEFQTLLRRVPAGSIIKITLNANSASLGGPPGPGLQAARLEKFLHDFRRCLPVGFGEEGVTSDEFPLSLLKVLDYAATEALKNKKEWRFQPLTSSVYADGQKMLTVTGIVGTREAVRDWSEYPELKRWFFYRPKWETPVLIEVPELTLKERIHINQLLPELEKNIGEIHRKLGCWVDLNLEDSERKLKNYVAFHRHYPHFGKVAI